MPLVSRALPTPIAAQPPLGVRTCALTLDATQLQQLRHATADRTLARLQFNPKRSLIQRPKLDKAQPLRQLEHNLERKALPDPVCEMIKLVSEDDHKLPPIGPTRVTLLNYPN